MDYIHIEKLECRAHVGVPFAERRKRQTIHLDIALGCDLKKAGKRDDVRATVDYAAVAASVKKFVESGSFCLVEAIAEKVAELILARFALKEVRVRVRKFSVPGTAGVGVEILRPS